MKTQQLPETLLKNNENNVIEVEDWRPKVLVLVERPNLAGWLVLALLIILATASLGKLLTFSPRVTEGRETTVYPDSLPSLKKAVHEPDLVSLKPSIPEPTPIPVIPVEELEEKLNQFITTGTGEAEAQQAASYFSQNYQELAVRKAVELLGQLSSYESRPEVERLAKVTLWLCPLLEPEIQGKLAEIAKKEASAVQVSPSGSETSPEAQNQGGEIVPPPVAPLSFGIGVSSKVVVDLKRILKAYGPNSSWEVTQVRKLGPFTRITLKQVTSEGTQFITWIGIPLVMVIPKEGETVTAKSLLDILFP